VSPVALENRNNRRDLNNVTSERIIGRQNLLSDKISHQTRSIFLHNPRRPDAAALKCSGMMMPPLTGDPVTNCIAPFAMIMLSLIRKLR